MYLLIRCVRLGKVFEINVYDTETTILQCVIVLVVPHFDFMTIEFDVTFAGEPSGMIFPLAHPLIVLWPVGTLTPLPCTSPGQQAQ